MTSRISSLRRPDPGANTLPPQDRWILSYADFITLLMAFFVVMYSISSVNDGKARVLSDSMIEQFRDRSASSNGEPESPPLPVDMGGGEAAVSESFAVVDAGGAAPAQVLEHAALEHSATVATEAIGSAATGPFAAGPVRVQLENALAPYIEQGDIRVTDNSGWIEVELQSELLFASGSPRLGNGAYPLVTDLARIVNAVDTPVRVEGFTDSVAIRGGPYDSNWQLSAARAGAVAEHLARSGVDPLRISAVGFGEYRPVADNRTAEGRSRNRRVIVALAQHPMPGLRGAAEDSGDVGLPKDELPATTLQRVTALPGPEDLD